MPLPKVGFLLCATEGAEKLIAVVTDSWTQSANCRGLLHCSLDCVGQGCFLLLLCLKSNDSMSKTLKGQSVQFVSPGELLQCCRV